MKNTNTMISWSPKGGHIYGSKAGYTTRRLAEAVIETHKIEKELWL